MEGQKSSFIYNVEILIEDENHQAALIQILKKLNTLNVVDYKITSGILLGEEIQARKQKAKSEITVPVSSEQLKTTSNKVKAEKKTNTQTTFANEQLKGFRDQNKLIRLIVNRGLGIKLNIPCRVLNIDENDSMVSVYHVDEKQVYTFRLIEIEDIIES